MGNHVFFPFGRFRGNSRTNDFRVQRLSDSSALGSTVVGKPTFPLYLQGFALLEAHSCAPQPLQSRPLQLRLNHPMNHIQNSGK